MESVDCYLLTSSRACLFVARGTSAPLSLAIGMSLTLIACMSGLLFSRGAAHGTTIFTTQASRLFSARATGQPVAVDDCSLIGDYNQKIL